MRNLICCLLLMTAVPLAAATTNNDDSCDIGTYPAATLLLPYFEVDLGAAGAGKTTVFSITNVSPTPQIVSVTLWTDWAYPVITFPLLLTGYDVQPINLYDVIVRGLIGSTTGTSTSSPNARDSGGASTNPNLGTTPLTNLANPNFLASASTNCAAGRLPGLLPPSLSSDVRSLLSTGRSTQTTIRCGGTAGTDTKFGGEHGNKAIGYATVDVLATCSPAFPTDAAYWSLLLYDNVLTGDYQIVDSNPVSGNYAAGNPLVHIRAIPEGGAAGSTQQTDLPFTFYNRLTTTDRRQPLPSTFAARWIAGSNAAFATNYTVWREALTASTASCDQYVKNQIMYASEIVRFDEHENATVGLASIFDPRPAGPIFPATSSTGSTSGLFPPMLGTDNGGWMYLNMNNGGSAAGAAYSASRAGFGTQANTRDVSQNWVVVSMFAEGRFGVESDATSLGNGCSPAAPFVRNANDPDSAAGRIGPLRNVNP
jgi:hypothetical protein